MNRKNPIDAGPNRDSAAVDRLAARLIEAYSAQIEAEARLAPAPSFFVARVRNRIRERREQNISSWETSVMAMRGWVIALGAAAILFFVVSTQLQSSPSLENSTDEINVTEELIGDVR
ncbi:MAG: hypothetical protein ACKVX9_10465 [Blastocatellia bacterium]